MWFWLFGEAPEQRASGPASPDGEIDSLQMAYLIEGRLLLILGFVRRSGDAVSKLDWAGDGAERLEAFAGAKDRHVAIVEHASEN